VPVAVSVSGASKVDTLVATTRMQASDPKGRELAEGQTLTNSHVGVGDRIIQVTTGAAVGTAGLAVSAPVAVVDPCTRQNFQDHVENFGQTVDLPRPWPDCEPVLQQVEQAVESPIREVHLWQLRRAIQSQAPALVGRLSADLRSKPGQRRQVVTVHGGIGYRNQIKRTGPDEVKEPSRTNHALSKGARAHI
jgi:hypothetical protein